MTNHDLDRALARLARRQHGAFSHDQVTGLEVLGLIVGAGSWRTVAA